MLVFILRRRQEPLLLQVVAVLVLLSYSKGGTV